MATESSRWAATKLEKLLTEADLALYRKLRDTFRGPLLKFGAVKGVLDGTVDAGTAGMFEPYVGGGTGIPFWEQDDLNNTVALYDKEGFRSCCMPSVTEPSIWR